VVEEGKVAETPDRSPETVPGTSPLLAPLGFAFWRIKGAFEREMGVSAGTWFALALLARKDGMSQGELSHRFEIDRSRERACSGGSVTQRIPGWYGCI
jgi:hypothetical protein